MVTHSKPSAYRPSSPKRKSNPVEVYKQVEANVSPNYYKWQVISYKQINSSKDNERFIFSQDVICLKHGETQGLLSHDDLSTKRDGDPAYVRIYKGVDESDKYTTHNLFEIEFHNE